MGGCRASWAWGTFHCTDQRLWKSLLRMVGEGSEPSRVGCLSRLTPPALARARLRMDPRGPSQGEGRRQGWDDPCS